MIFKKWGLCICGLQTGQVFLGPASLAANSYLVYLLKPQTLFAYRYGHPQSALVILEAIPCQPGSPLGELY